MPIFWYHIIRVRIEKVDISGWNQSRFGGQGLAVLSICLNKSRNKGPKVSLSWSVAIVCGTTPWLYHHYKYIDFKTTGKYLFLESLIKVWCAHHSCLKKGHQGLVVKVWWFYPVVQIIVVPSVTKSHRVNPLKILVSLCVGYIFAKMHWILTIKNNNLFWNVVPNFWL